MAADMLGMATIGAATVIGMESEVGSLVPGKRADIVAIRPFAGSPVDADPSLVVLDPRSRVVAAWVDGDLVLSGDDPVHMDVGSVIADATESRNAIV